MVADTEVSPEPQFFQEALSASEREHPSSPADPVSVSAGTAPQTSQREDTALGVGASQMRVTVENQPRPVGHDPLRSDANWRTFRSLLVKEPSGKRDR